MQQTQAFNAVYRRGRWTRGAAVSLGVLPTQQPQTRVGLRTRRGVKPAVVRNRLKRQLRAILAGPEIRLRDGFDLVIVLHPPKLPISTQQLREELGSLCKKAGIIV